MGKHKTSSQQVAPKLIRLKGQKWYFNFKVAGRWFGDCTEFYKSDFDKANALAHRVRNDAVLGVFNIKKPESPERTKVTLAELFARYWDEIACHFKTASNDFYYMKNLERIIGPKRSIDEIGTNEVSEWVAKRRREPIRGRKDRSRTIAPGTVNRETELLKRVFFWARDVKNLPMQPIKWSAPSIKLTEAPMPERELTIEKEIALFAALRSDYVPIVQFLLFTGQRLDNCVRLTWDQIRWTEREIVFRIKSKGRRGDERWHVLPVEDEVVWKILRSCRGHHPTFVFTYVAARSCTYARGQKLVQGERYPVVAGTLRRSFKAALNSVGISREFRLHDLRHSCAARMRDAGADITDVQLQLGHTTINMTTRYFRTSKRRVRDAQQRTAAWRSQSLAKVQAAESKTAVDQ